MVVIWHVFDLTVTLQNGDQSAGPLPEFYAENIIDMLMATRTF